MTPKKIVDGDTSELGGASRWRGASARSAAKNRFVQTLLVVLVGVGILGSALTYGLRFPIERAIREEAVRDVVERVRPRFLKFVDPKNLVQPTSESQYAELDRSIREFVLEPGIGRLKLWSASGTVLYSTLPGQVGESYPEETDIQEAIEEGVVWEWAEETESTAESELGQVLEVYLPLVWTPGGAPEAVLEIYVPLERYSGLLASIKNAILGAALLASFALPIALYLLYQVGSRQINREHHRNELILSSTGDGIFGLDSNGHCAFVNPAAARMLGREVNELIGQSPHDLIHHSKPDGTPYPFEECPIRAAFQDGSASRVSDELFWRKNGTSFPVEYVATPILERRGRVSGAVVAFQDVTERREVERLKDEFVSTVSHELRTPLTSIRGSLGLLSSGLLGSSPEQGKSLLQIAVNNTDRLIRIINEILDFERMRAGKIEVVMEACEAAGLMAQMEGLMWPVAKEGGITLSISPTSGRLWANPDRVIQVFTNLLGNAIKFSPRGATVWLTAEHENDHMLFKIRDQGRGIPSDQIGLLFERFQQVDSSQSGSKGGSGLGLAICRSIVDLHGGRIWAESKVGEGSTFYFTLPLLTQPGTVSEATGPTVLVCDDDLSVLEVLAAQLQHEGYQPIKAHSGSEAIELAANNRPSVILLDILMPGMSGWETVVALKERSETRDIPIIMLSALQPGASKTDTPQVIGWLGKPVDEAALFRALRGAVTGQDKVSRILIVGGDWEMARVLTTQLEREGIETFHANTGEKAISLAQSVIPDLVILDVILPDRDSFAVVDWLRQHDRLSRVPVVVYTGKEIEASDQHQLTLGETVFVTKGTISPEEFRRRVVGLLNHVIPSQHAGRDGKK